MNKSYQKYWSEFLSATGRNSSDHEGIPVDEFGDSPELADALIKLILEGTKSATCGLLIAHEKENYPIPPSRRHRYVPRNRSVSVRN
ncbi:MAG: hypothetical protein ABF377_06615 [Akkermansiaceae bacterium]